MRRSWLAIALLGWAVCIGCSANGNGSGGGGIVVQVTPGAFNAGITLSEKFTADVTGTSNKAVTWSVSQSGTACSPACGTIASDGTYTAPATVPTDPQVTVTATSQENSHAVGTASVKVVDISVNVNPTPVSVGFGLQEQFTARALPDDPKAQGVTWSIAGCNLNDCGSIDANTGLYQAPNAAPSEKFTIQATSTLDPTNGTVGTAAVSVVQSRLPKSTGSTSYTFRFSGYDGSGGLVAIVGSFKSNGDGTIASGGVEDVISSAGGPATHTITGGSYTLNSNNQGSITLNATGFTRTYTMVLDASGDIQIIENDSNGHGSGVIAGATPSKFNTAGLAYNFVFGFTGMDSTGNRVGYAGLLPVGAGGAITNGLADVNDNGTANAYTSVTGTLDVTNGIGTLQVVLGATTLNFEVYGVAGANNVNNPLTMYAVSAADPIDSTHPALSGTLLYQDSSVTYDKTALNHNSSEIVNLTGADHGGTNVSLTVLSPDGNGSILGSFDQNDAGTITGPALQFSGCTYASSSGNVGRYTVNLLGNASCTTSTPFVLYLRGANRGFLLDQSSASVMTGTMDQQKTNQVANSDMEGSFAAGTASAGASAVTPTVANLLFSAYPTTGVSGTQYPGGETVTGTPYAMNGAGYGTLTVTAPASASYVIYALDAGSSKDTSVGHFWIIDVTRGNTNPFISLAQR